MKNEQPLQPDTQNEVGEFEDLENKVDIAIEEDEEFGSESEKRVENWKNKSEEERTKIVKEKREKLERDLEKNVELPEDLTEKTKELRAYQKELKIKNRAFVEERGDIVSNIQSQLDGGIDISSLDLGDRSEFKNVLSSFRNVAKNTLEIEKADYYLEAGEDKLGDLLETHEDREISMEILEKIMGQIGDFEKYLKDLEDMTAEQLEVAEGEVKELLDKLNDIYKKNPDLFKKLLAAGAVIGVLILAAVVLGPAAVALYEWASVIELGSIAPGATKALFDCIGKGGAMTAGAVVGGGTLLKVFSWFSKEENRDKVAEGIFRAKMPAIAYLFNGRPGEKKS
ncbi:hypothetical protein KAI56_00465 [Candidatus Parcubacteria bacterium]|nr:hypothetical protein [Candidatus Parcubacteria bacterium]